VNIIEVNAMNAAILRALADAHEAAARTLRRHSALLGDDETMAVTSTGATADSVLERVRSLHPQLGSRQEEVVALLDEAGDHGLDTGVMSRSMDYDQPNVYLTLQSLVRHGFVERDTSVSPHTYRLTEDLRRHA
jgi:hypothetical protein